MWTFRIAGLIFLRCRGDDPFEDTESYANRTLDALYYRVAEGTIRLRILKDLSAGGDGDSYCSCRGDDPFEDTERGRRAFGLSSRAALQRGRSV